jgi:hypothetical protein
MGSASKSVPVGQSVRKQPNARVLCRKEGGLRAGKRRPLKMTIEILRRGRFSGRRHWTKGYELEAKRQQRIADFYTIMHLTQKPVKRKIST